MLVEFSELLDRTELSPVATNMTVEAMPNDNLVRTKYIYIREGEMLTLFPLHYCFLIFSFAASQR